MSKTKYDWEYMSDAVDRLMPDSTERGAMLSVASGLMKAAYAAGVLAGRAEQRAADADICQQMGDEWEAEEDLKAELYACRDAIRAANLPAPGAMGQANG